MRTALDGFLAGLRASGLRVVDHDVEQGPCATIADSAGAIFVELARRSADAPCYARTVRFDVSVRPLVRGDRLRERERELADRVVAILEAWEQTIVLPERAGASGAGEVREIQVERGLVSEGQGRYYLNPYSGCTIGCGFCWVADRADLGRALTGRSSVAWGRWVDVKVNLAEVIREEVSRLPPGIVRMSPVVTDPYQPLERRYRISRASISTLLEAGFAPVVLTRARLVLEDLPLFARYPDRIAVGISIPTDDDAVRRHFERAADPIEVRLETLRALRAAGIVTFAVVQPVLPMNTDRLIAEIAPHVDAIRIDHMHEVGRALPLYEAAGCVEAARPAFARETIKRLVEGFTSAGVAVDARDDLASLVLTKLRARGDAALALR